VFPVRYDLDLYILFIRNSVFRGLKRMKIAAFWDVRPCILVNIYQWFGGSWSRYSGGLEGLSSIPDRGKIYIFSTASRPALGPTQPLIQRVPGGGGGDFHGVKLPDREADHSPLSSVEGKNGGAIPALPHASL
jgi:hypothetical protein